LGRNRSLRINGYISRWASYYASPNRVSCSVTRHYMFVALRHRKATTLMRTWLDARAAARRAGVLLAAHTLHCAVGTKPRQ
jgi:hypothetical protein